MFIEKKYGTIVVGTIFFVIVFTAVGLVVFGLTQNLWFQENSMISKIGTGTSMIGVFLGTFIAVWLINRDKVKNIEEQHVYKVAVLHDLSTMIISVQQALHHAKTSGEPPDRIKEYANYKLQDWKYWANRIQNVNNNSYIPPHIRDSINLLLYEGAKPLGSICTAQNSPDFVKTTLIDRLNIFIDSDFVSSDKDSSVKNFLKHVRDARKTVLDTIEPPKNS